jgi:hypothetical protein
MDYRRFVPGLTLAVAASAATAGSALLFHTAGVQAVADGPARPPAPDVALRSVVQLDVDAFPVIPVSLPPRINADPVVAPAADRSGIRQAPAPQPGVQPATRDVLAEPTEPAPLEEPPPIVEQPQADNNFPVELPPGEAPPNEDDAKTPVVARDAPEPPLEPGGGKTGTPPRER